MNFSLFIAAFVAVVSTASPVKRFKGEIVKIIPSTPSQSLIPTIVGPAPRTSAVGAAFSISNEEDVNHLIIAEIASNGKLTLRSGVETGGKGAHGITNATVPDALFSQGAVKVSAAGRIVAAVNPGSSTFSVFKIDPLNPTNVTQLGDPHNSGGEFPVSLTINNKGDVVCVLNGGAINGVNCYTIDGRKGPIPLVGTLRALNLEQSTPATGPAGTASQIIFSEDNTQLIAAVKGIPPQPGFLAVWDVASDGSLSKDFRVVISQQRGLLPSSLTVIPGTNAILATDAGFGFDVFDLKASQPNNSMAVTIDDQSATLCSSFSTKTGNFYLADTGASIVTEISMDKKFKATLVKRYPQGEGSGITDNDIATVNNTDFLYLLSANTTTIKILSLNSPGNAKSVQEIDIAGPAKQAGITISPNNIQGMATFIRE